jgi:hypothetical protein
MIVITAKEKIIQSPKKFEMEGLYNQFEPRSRME